MGTIGEVLARHRISFEPGQWPELMLWTINGNILVSGEVTAISPIDSNDLALYIFAVPDLIAELATNTRAVSGNQPSLVIQI